MNKPMPLPKALSPLSLPAPPLAAKMLTWREIVGVFRRRLWLIILVTGLATMIAALWFVAAYKFNVWPGQKYTSYASIECEMPIRDNPLTGIQLIPHRDLIELETQTQEIHLNGEAFLQSILGRTVVQESAWLNQNIDQLKRLKKFKSSFAARAQRNSSLIILSMTTSNANESQDILDDILTKFQKDIEDQSSQELRDRRSAMDGQRFTVQNEITAKNTRLISMLASNEPGFEEGQSRAWDEFKLMHNEKLILDAQVSNVDLMLGSIQQEMDTLGYSNAVQMEVENSPRVMFLNNQIVDQESRLAQIRERLGENNQQVKQIRASIDGLKNQLDSLRLQLMVQYSKMQKMMLEQDNSSKKSQRKDVIAKYEAAEIDLETLTSRRFDFLRTQTELEDLKEQLRRLDDRIYELDIQRDNTGGATAKVRTHATEPLGISSPRPILWIPAGFFLGLMASVGLILLLEFVDDSVKSPSDVRRYLNIPLLGMIPRHQEADTDLLHVAKIAYTKPQALISEAFRQVRTNLYFSAPADEMKTILITSSSAGCGKTTVAVNLAITLAAEGKRILLVDANFRRAAINRLFGAEGPPRGLSNILVGQIPAAEAVRQSEVEGLDLVDAGPAPPNPSVLLSGTRMKDFLENQKQYYDHIILDGPPMLVVTDARIIAGMVDGTIAVVHAGDTSRGVVQRMIGELKNNQVNILGVLLNAVRALKGGYFGESYRSYYEYIGAETTAARSLPEKAGHDLVES